MKKDIDKGIEYFQKAKEYMESDDTESLEKAIFLLNRGMDACLVSINETIKKVPLEKRETLRNETKHDLKIRRITTIEKLIAQGLTRTQIAARMEMTCTRISQLTNEKSSVENDPKFIELMNK